MGRMGKSKGSIGPSTACSERRGVVIKGTGTFVCPSSWRHTALPGTTRRSTLRTCWFWVAKTAHQPISSLDLSRAKKNTTTATTTTSASYSLGCVQLIALPGNICRRQRSDVRKHTISRSRTFSSGSDNGFGTWYRASLLVATRNGPRITRDHTSSSATFRLVTT